MHANRNAVPLICFVVAMIDGYDTQMMSFLAPLISKEWGMAAGSFGKIFASTYGGGAVGATLIGIAADRFGRKTMLLFSLALAGICVFFSAWSSGPSELMLWRAVSGLGLGGAIPTISALTAQHAPLERRSSAVARMFLGYPVGAMVGGAITAALMSSIGWRSVLMGGGMCAFLLVPLVWFCVTESSGGDTHALAATHSRHPLAELVADGRGWGTVLICAATFLTLLVSYFLLSWTPTILTLVGTSPKRAALATVVLNLGGLAGAWILSSLVRRNSPLVAITAYLGVGSLLVALLGQGVIATVLVAFLTVFVVGLLIIGAMSNLPALCVYYYPASVYGTGVGLGMAIGRLGSIVGPLIGGYLVSARMGWDRLFLLAALPALTAALALAIVAVIRKGR